MFAVRWQSDRGAGDDHVDARDVGRLLGAGSPGLRWLDLVSGDGADLAVLADATGYPVADLLADGRSRLLVDRTRVALVLRVVEPVADRLRAVAFVVAASPDWIVTCRGAPFAGDDPLDGARARLSARSAAEVTAAQALLAIVDAVVDGQMTLSDELDDRLADAEEVLLDDPASPLLYDVLPRLRRDVMAMHRVAGPLRRALALLVDGRAPLMTTDDIAALRHQHDAVVQLREQVDTQLALLTSLTQTQLTAASIRA
ncbi:MAG TPA: CorA family divalent cation transporter, partial [Euzebyales bacterium]|nr:CorA family divalent cation transporter [Euzebyales bacterium]